MDIDKEEMKKRMDDLGNMIKDFGDMVKDATDTAVIVGLETKDVLAKKMEDAQSELEAMREKARQAAERSSSKFSSEMIKAQMNFNQAKENMQQKKDAMDKEKLERYIQDQLDYAEQAISLAAVASEEAKLAFLNACKAKEEYNEKYGNTEGKKEDTENK